ncbi:L-type lectin-domain containing receptor kinase IV.1-like isoform X3 [Camellia sinensis]|uniref:L-type lectin-domain containing receptor kinase IV.1-like isoform X3 n=1 Tax=Camellia sinensis TaxID=4442 RepID=UPI001035808E|nr:L-type lectin-domain containing receptor kinase IV.1-like isoform X3 [Camellia sinensis]
MTTTPKPVHFLLLIYVCLKTLVLAQDENQFIYNGFQGANLHLDGLAQIHPNGLLQLTDTSVLRTGHAFYQLPIKFNDSLPQTLSFSTNFVFVMVPEYPDVSGHGIAFTISPSTNFTGAFESEYLGLLNPTNNGLASNHLLAIELDTIKNRGFNDIDNNHVGIDVNNLTSNDSAPASYYSSSEGKNKTLKLISGNPIQVWIDYDGMESLLNVTLAPIPSPKPNRPLLSTHIDLSPILLDPMYVGFSSSTGATATNHYILGWSFNKSGKAQSIEISKLPPFPHQRKPRGKPVELGSIIILIIIIFGVVCCVRRKKYEEIQEDWEQEYGPQRFSYKDLYKATKGFQSTELLGVGGFGKVYRGVLPSSKELIAVKKISHDSRQGMREFVAEIVSMGRLRHRNLVRLLGYCRRKGELLLVYDYMPNGSLDKFLFGSEQELNWVQRYQILRGVASALQYLHEEWEQVVLHRDVKASNVLLDADLNGRLGDFGLARLYDHGENLETTNVVGTLGYLAPEFSRTGQATTSTDVYSFGAFMLEVACGRKPIETRRLPEERVLIDWVIENWKQGAILETSDPRLRGEYLKEEMELVLKLGLFCSHTNAAVRPSMRQVVQYLDGDALFPNDILLDIVGISTLGVRNEASPEFVSFPSSVLKGFHDSASSSLLHSGR